MPLYISLLSLTEQGIRNLKGAPERLRLSEQLAEQLGAKIHAFYLTMGTYDYVEIFEAPDDETAARLLLTVAGRGNVRSTTLKAFTREQFERIVAAL